MSQCNINKNVKNIYKYDYTKTNKLVYLPVITP